MTLGEIGRANTGADSTETGPVTAIGGAPSGGVDSGGPPAAGGSGDAPPDNSPVLSMPDMGSGQALGDGLDALITPVQALVDGLGDALLQFSPVAPLGIPGAAAPNASSSSNTSSGGGALGGVVGGVGDAVGGVLQGLGGVLQSITGQSQPSGTEAPVRPTRTR